MWEDDEGERRGAAEAGWGWPGGCSAAASHGRTWAAFKVIIHRGGRGARSRDGRLKGRGGRPTFGGKRGGSLGNRPEGRPKTQIGGWGGGGNLGPGRGAGGGVAPFRGGKPGNPPVHQKDASVPQRWEGGSDGVWGEGVGGGKRGGGRGGAVGGCAGGGGEGELGGGRWPSREEME